MKRAGWIRMMVLAPFLLAACYPHGVEYATDTDVAVTNYNPNYDFKPKKTFSIPDKIVKITGNVVTGDPPKYVPDVLATPMLQTMANNMTALGYTKVDISQKPDLVLAPAALETTTVSYWYDYWGWYWGGYYPGWGYPYYPYYPVYTTSYSTGTLIMMLIDPSQSGGDGNAISQWTGAGSGILTNSYDITRINKLINQAFAQSPYLKK